MLEVGSDFSGVGALDQALLAMEIPYKKQFVCDYNEYARQSYIINYGTAADKELVFSKEHKQVAKKVTSIIENDEKAHLYNPEEVFAEAEILARKFSFYYPFNVYNRVIPDKSLDLYITSPPCQGFSMAGKREGSILFFNSLEFIAKNNPRYFIFENVKGLLSHEKDKKNKKALYGKTFQEWLNFLGGKSVNGNATFFPYDNSVPYHIYFQVINAKEHDVPQNRERVFIIGIRDDSDNNFTFPKSVPLTKRLKDILETDVDEKYFLSEQLIEGFLKHKERHDEKGTGFSFKPKEKTDIANTLRANAALCATDNMIKEGFINQDTQASQVYNPKGVSPNVCASTYGYIIDKNDETPIVEFQLKGGKWDKTHEQSGRVYNVNGISPTIHTMGGGNQEPKIAINSNETEPKILGYTRDEKGKVVSRHEIKVANTITTSTGGGGSTDQFVKEPQIGAFRGRNLENPKSREKGIELEQTLEINKDGVSNTLTSVQKDNVVLVPSATKEGFEIAQIGEDSISLAHKNSSTARGKVGKGVAQTIDTTNNQGIFKGHRIRKLTPTECFRLMDFAESFMDNIKKHNEENPKKQISDSQLYKQAGNSIVRKMFIILIEKLNLQ